MMRNRVSTCDTFFMEDLVVRDIALFTNHEFNPCIDALSSANEH